jgi:beta-lactamase class A
LKRGSYTLLRWISIALIFAAILLSIFQLVRYSRIRSSFPAGTKIAGVAVGGLDLQQTSDRLIQAYSMPIEVHYGDAVIQIKPSNLGFKLELESMITAADIQRVRQPFWSAFWDYLWNRLPGSMDIPLDDTIDQKQLKTYLQNEIASRYDTPPEPAIPVPGSVNFQPGKPGKVLDISKAAILVEDALKSPTARIVNLTYNSVNPSKPSFQNLGVLLRQIIDASSFSGITEVYILDLQNGNNLSFAYQDGTDLNPDIAFNAASSIKIPVMVSVFRRLSDPAPVEITTLMEQMIERSDNSATDEIMQTVLDLNTGPLIVTDDMKALGFKDTFIVGYFYVGAPRLKEMITPANSRTDVNTNPDTYNQTTPSEISMLLEDIYQCAQDGGGTFAVVFPGQISKNECQSMINYLLKNKIAVLLQAGLPDGTRIAHKHGWITETDGLMHSISDAGIIYSAGGNYIMSVSMYNPVQLVFDPANRLVAQLSTAVYNYYNTSQ